MSNKDNEEDPIFYPIPQNVLGSSKRFLNFPQRNWIEGIISSAIVAWIICQVPFVNRVKIIVVACVCVAVLIINLIGIKNMSLSEVIVNFYQFKKEQRNYHLRSIRNAKKQKFNEKSGKITVSLNESLLEKGIRVGKEKYKNFVH